MAIKINKEDKYFGLALYTFLQYNSNVKECLIKIDNYDTSCYEITGATGDTFYLFIKYRSTVNQVFKDGAISWALKLTDSDKKTIEEKAKTGHKVFILVVCCNQEIENTNFLVLTYNEYVQVRNLKIVNIKLANSEKRPEKKFSIYKDRKIIYKISRNRIEKDLLKIHDAEILPD